MTRSYLVDKSALARVGHSSVQSVLGPLTERGLLAISIATELELGFSAQSSADYQTSRRAVSLLVPIALSPRAEQRAREVQHTLVARGQHRSAGVADLLIAATAEIEGLTVLHYDADFDLIAEVTGQPTEWVVPRGSID